MSNDAPAVCPACGTSIPAASVQCPGCARVFGDDNHCPHCRAFAPVRSSNGKLVCTACGKPREKGPKTVVIEELGGSGEELTARAGSLVFSVLGGLSIATAIAGGLVGVFAFRWIGVFAGIIQLAMSAALARFGWWAWQRGKSGGGALAMSTRANVELRVLALAEEHDGVLRVTDVMRAFKLTSAEAEKLLSGLVDGSRVTLEVDSEGLMTYRFRELQKITPVRARVEVAEELEQLPADVENAQKERKNP